MASVFTDITDPPVLDSTAQAIATTLSEMKSIIRPSNICLDVDISLPVDGWSSSVPYTYTWTSDKVTTECGVKVNFLEGSTDGTMYIEYEKVPNGVQFVAPTKPTAAIPVRVHILNAEADSINAVNAELVSTDAVSGASNVHQALGTLDDAVSAVQDGLNALNSKIAGEEVAIIANNVFLYRYGNLRVIQVVGNGMTLPQTDEIIPVGDRPFRSAKFLVATQSNTNMYWATLATDGTISLALAGNPVTTPVAYCVFNCTYKVI